METNGKLVVKTYINHTAPDIHGRQHGRWVTLLTQHGLSYDEAEAAGKQFAELNAKFNNEELYAQWIPYPKPIYL